MNIIGQRLRAARALRGFNQAQLAVKMGLTREAVSMIEAGRSRIRVDRLGTAARMLGVSTDYLEGLTEDPTPAGQLSRALAAATGGEPHDDRHERGAAPADGDYVGVHVLAVSAGGGDDADDQRVTGRLKFRRRWLDRHGLVARSCRVIAVVGESMEPTVADGSSILVNHASRRRRLGHIYVVRTQKSLVVTRAGRDPAGVWQLVSDNPDKLTWPNRPWPPDADIVGEVRWTARTFT